MRLIKCGTWRECVLDVLDFCSRNANDVKPCIHVDVVGADERVGSQRQSVHLLPGDGLEGRRETVGCACLHFDEYQCAAINSHNVNLLSATVVPVARYNLVAFVHEILRCSVLALRSGVVMLCHLACSVILTKYFGCFTLLNMLQS